LRKDQIGAFLRFRMGVTTAVPHDPLRRGGVRSGHHQQARSGMTLCRYRHHRHHADTRMMPHLAIEQDEKMRQRKDESLNHVRVSLAQRGIGVIDATSRAMQRTLPG